MHHLLPIPSLVAFALMLLPSVAGADPAADAKPRLFVIPGTGLEFALGATPAAPRLPDPALVAAIQEWLADVLGLPAEASPPRFVHAARADMAAMWLGGDLGEHAKTAKTGHLPQIVALYDARTETIYLPDDWSGTTPAQLSILVHEMVHHLQQVAGLDYACTGRREEPAYRAQAEWLGLFGTDLEEAFQIDAFTLVLQTHCFY